MTPLAIAILAEPSRSPDVRSCLERFFRWGAAPTIDAYCDLFTPNGTLLDADMDQPISGAAIRESITRVLALLPDFRFTPQRVLHDGPHVFVLAANSATLGERRLAWEAVYALTLEGDRIAAGRRYYDQAALVLDAETFAGPSAPAPGKRVADGSARVLGPADGAAIDVTARADAWNRQDVSALVDPLGSVRFHMSGVARPLEQAADVTAALGRFAVRSDGLRVAPGAVARTARGIGIEWVGTIGAGAQRRRLSLVELIGPQEWRVLFNTLGL
jgi:ketosteroid isomerase-like protein